MSSLFQAFDYNNWISRLNVVRAKSGIDLNNLTLSVTSGTPGQASQVNNLKDAILGMKTQTYLSYADYSAMPTTNITAGEPISQSLKDNIESTVASIESICPNNTTQANTTNTTDVTLDRDSYKTCTTDSTFSNTCKTNTVSSGDSTFSNTCSNLSTWSFSLRCSTFSQGTCNNDTTNRTWNYSATSESFGTWLYKTSTDSFKSCTTFSTYTFNGNIFSTWTYSYKTNSKTNTNLGDTKSCSTNSTNTTTSFNTFTTDSTCSTQSTRHCSTYTVKTE